jgi:glycosyltransferase involved in cell wall biosynthesis
MIKVKMIPHKDKMPLTNGIGQVVHNYFKYLPNYGIELVPQEANTYDLTVGHAGMFEKTTDIAMIHGLYWSADYDASSAEIKANKKIVDSLRNAREVTVPSEWVAETIRRDMRFNPWVVPHGIDVDLWENEGNGKYVLWNKERSGVDVCDPTGLAQLAQTFPAMEFISTFTPKGFSAENVQVVGKVPHAQMKTLVQQCGIYTSLVKETFGIGIAEALAAGKPILGWAHGGNLIMVEHGVNGYLAEPGNYEDLFDGLQYCAKNWKTLGKNSREMAKKFDWPSAVKLVADIYKLAMAKEEHNVSVVIPHFQYADKVERALVSATKQTLKPEQIFIVDDGSSNEHLNKVREIVSGVASKNSDIDIQLLEKANGGVATARNHGILHTNTDYICCLDADDEIAPRFLEVCVEALKNDRSLGIAYTGLHYKQSNGKEGVSQWPEQCNYDAHLSVLSHSVLRGKNQVPTCNVFRREAWERTGGYKQRYAPLGAGAEDAEFWARIMSIGYGAEKVTDEGLFIYYDQGFVSTHWREGDIDRNLVEPPWLALHPWSVDGQHPFASRATPLGNEMAHRVRQYDEPLVTVVIPVGEGHEELVEDALDSVESQTFRKWETVLVWDSPQENPLARIRRSYPYVRIITTGGGKGAGFARNRGAEQARGSFLVFLDADDKIEPTFIERTLSVYSHFPAVIYTDYISTVATTQEDLNNNFSDREVLRFVEKTGEALIGGRSADYNCERAQRQPTYELKTDPFHWCLVTCLIPKAWHDDIGGFDETMESFEDVLYHWVMARSGYCYTRLPKRLVNYRMHTGQRRNIALRDDKKIGKSMLNYSKSVLEKIDMAGCKGCPDKNRVAPNIPSVNSVINAVSARDAESAKAQDENYILITYHGAKGNHHVYGRASNTKGELEYYGYRSKGQQFLVHKEDQALQPHLFVPVTVEIHTITAPSVNRTPPQKPIPLSSDPTESGRPVPVEFEAPEELVKEEAEEELEEPVEREVVAMDEEIDLQSLPISAGIAAQLKDMGVETKNDILALGIKGLMKLNGVGKIRAELIIESIQV